MRWWAVRWGTHGLHAPESARKLNSSALVVSRAMPFSFRLGVNPTKQEHQAAGLLVAHTHTRLKPGWRARVLTVRTGLDRSVPRSLHVARRIESRYSTPAVHCCIVASRHALGSARACTCLCWRLCVCARSRAHARLGIATQGCTTQGYSRAAPLVLAGHQRRRTRWRTRAHGVHSGVRRGYSQKVRTCV